MKYGATQTNEPISVFITVANTTLVYLMLLIVQPWFAAVGHPAQSLINTAKTIGRKDGTIYLVAMRAGDDRAEATKIKLQKYGIVEDYPVNTDSIREGTVKALGALKRLIAQNPSLDSVLFFDAHLVILALLWPIYYQSAIKSLSIVYLKGPERILRFGILKYLIGRFLKRKKIRLLVRTEELAADWKKAFPAACISCLPSLELPVEIDSDFGDPIKSETIRLGVLGQVRKGKGLEWLVPLFKNDPQLGKLSVAGTFNNAAERTALNVLNDFDGFEDKFLTEEELLGNAAKQDYLLMLYDHWDHRMEGAVMYLAARVNRPVIVYDKGWCGRMVREYGNGVLAPEDHVKFAEFVRALPRSGSNEYKQLLKGVDAFRQAHMGERVRNAFLKVIGANHVSG